MPGIVAATSVDSMPVRLRRVGTGAKSLLLKRLGSYPAHNRQQPGRTTARATQACGKTDESTRLTCTNSVDAAAEGQGGRFGMASKRQRFAARRKAVGYSQEQLAERVGVERSTVV